MVNHNHHYNVPLGKLISARRFDAGYFRPEFLALDDTLAKLPKVKPLGALAEVEYGFMPTEDYALEEDGIPLIRVTNILTDASIDMSDVKYIRKNSDRLQDKLVRAKDILMVQCGNTTGKVAMVPPELEGHAYASFCFRIRPTTDEVTSEYLLAVLFSSVGYRQVWRSITFATVRPNTTKPYTKAIKIPLPPRDVQDRIAGVMQAAYAARREKLAEAERLLGEVDSLVFGKLKFSPENVKEETRFLKSVSALHGGRFDVAFNMGFHKFDPYPDQVTRIDDAVLFSKETKNPSKDPDTPFRYIDIASINVLTGEIGEATEMLGQEAPSRARQVVHEDDILISTVRPTRGAIAIVPHDMEGFVCSTGFAIVRSNGKILTEYLHTALRLSTTLEQFDRRSAGSSYPAILENDIQVTLIPLPSIEQQKEIADEITRRRVEAKRLRAEAEQVVAEAKAKVERMILGEEMA